MGLTGKLNTDVEKNIYEGGTTSTAKVTVDNNTNIITVDVTADISSMNKLYEELLTKINTLSEKVDELSNK